MDINLDLFFFCCGRGDNFNFLVIGPRQRGQTELVRYSSIRKQSKPLSSKSFLLRLSSLRGDCASNAKRPTSPRRRTSRRLRIFFIFLLTALRSVADSRKRTISSSDGFFRRKICQMLCGGASSIQVVSELTQVHSLRRLQGKASFHLLNCDSSGFSGSIFFCFNVLNIFLCFFCRVSTRCWHVVYRFVWPAASEKKSVPLVQVHGDNISAPNVVEVVLHMSRCICFRFGRSLRRSID